MFVQQEDENANGYYGGFTDRFIFASMFKNNKNSNQQYNCKISESELYVYKGEDIMAEEITKGLVKKKLEELGYPKNPRCI